MKRGCLILFLFCIAVMLRGQSALQEVVGKVSFISSQNVYVKFRSTEGISEGDTLFISSGDNKVPAFVVINLSSISCVCRQITSENVPVDHIVIAKPRIIVKPAIKEQTKPAEKVEKAVQDTSASKKNPPVRPQVIHGSLSVQSYSDLSSTAAGNSQKLRYILSLDAAHIGNSRLSAEVYTGFSYIAGQWSAVQNDIFSALKIYSFALKYDIGSSMNISLGRRINPRLSNIGAMDGVEFEASIKKFTVGAVSGFRPDYTDYGFNTNLFQAGGYVSYETKSEAANTQSSLAFMQQMNGSNTDRRFVYLQHSDMLGKNLTTFATCEIDLYKLVNDKPTTTFDLTSFYLSLRYRVSNNFWISGSYDARKNVIYYETYKTYLDYLMETATRQGYRLQFNYRISQALSAGVTGGYRFAKTDPSPSKNVYGYLTYNKLTGANLSVTLSGTYLQSSFMNNIMAGLTLSHSFFKGKLISEIGYRYMDYTMPEASSKVTQNIGEIYLSMPLSRFIFISLNYEGTFEASDTYNRIYCQIRLRF